MKRSIVVLISTFLMPKLGVFASIFSTKMPVKHIFPFPIGRTRTNLRHLVLIAFLINRQQMRHPSSTKLFHRTKSNFFTYHFRNCSVVDVSTWNLCSLFWKSWKWWWSLKIFGNLLRNSVANNLFRTKKPYNWLKFCALRFESTF